MFGKLLPWGREVRDLKKALPKSEEGPRVRSRCEPSKRLGSTSDPMPWTVGPTVLGNPPAPPRGVEFFTPGRGLELVSPDKVQEYLKGRARQRG